MSTHMNSEQLKTYMKKSTAESGVSLKVKSKAVLKRVASLLS